MKFNFTEELRSRVKIHENAEMRDFTTFQLGGSCRALIDCPTGDLLAEMSELLHRSGENYLIIGQGSNLLVSDQGLDCVVLRYCSEEPPELDINKNRVTVPGNMLLDDLARLAIESGLGDVSFCSGIPGTVGGAIAGNAGAFGQQIGDIVESVVLLDQTGAQREVATDELEFAYRNSALKKSGGIVLSAVLKLQQLDIAMMQTERERILAFRSERHPDWKTMPCAGSVFRNIEPTSAAERRQAAGWFLEEAGAKKLKVGSAHLFEKHANIIIAGEGSTARDVFELSEQMIAAVEKQFSFKLEREIRLLGEF